MDMRVDMWARADMDAEDWVATPFLDRILLWGMRAWTMAITQNIPVEEQVHSVFAKLGAANVAGQLYEFMWLLGHHANRTIDLDCVCCRHVSGDERSLLEILALMQRDRSFEALIRLRTMLAPNAALAATESAARVAQALTAAGRFLPAPPAETERAAFAPLFAALHESSSLH